MAHTSRHVRNRVSGRPRRNKSTKSKHVGDAVVELLSDASRFLRDRQNSRPEQASLGQAEARGPPSSPVVSKSGSADFGTRSLRSRRRAKGRRGRRALNTKKSQPWILDGTECQGCGRDIELCTCHSHSENSSEDESSCTPASSCSTSSSTTCSSKSSRSHRHRCGKHKCDKHKHKHHHKHHHGGHGDCKPRCPAPYGCYSGGTYRDNCCSYRRQITPVCGAAGCYLAETNVLSCPTRPCWAPGTYGYGGYGGYESYAGYSGYGGCAPYSGQAPYCGTDPSCLNGSLLPVREETLHAPELALPAPPCL